MEYNFIPRGGEILSLKPIYPMNLEEAQIAQKRTVAARSTEDGPLQCFIGSQRSLFEDDKLTDEQAELIIQCALQDKKFVLVKKHAHVRIGCY